MQEGNVNLGGLAELGVFPMSGSAVKRGMKIDG